MFITIKIDSKKKTEQVKILAQCFAGIVDKIGKKDSKLIGARGGAIVEKKDGKEKIVATYNVKG